MLKKRMRGPKNIFLLDGIGALVSAFFLGVVLVRFESLIGMPQNVLYILAMLPCFFAVYSFGCHLLLKSNWSAFLKGIAIANLSYCILTVSLLFVYYKSLTILGLLYFFVELLVVGKVITIELEASSKSIERRD